MFHTFHNASKQWNIKSCCRSMILSFLNANGKIQSIYVFFFQTIYALQIISFEAIKTPHNSHRKFKS